MSARRKYVVRLHLIGLAAALVLTGVVVVLLRGIAPPDAGRAVIDGSLTFLLIALIVEQVIAWQVRVRILAPTTRAANVAIRVAEGDLSTMPDDGGVRDDLTTSRDAMLDKLRTLVGTIRQHAHEAAAMSGQIAASTQQMTASTTEVASTTGDLTERANQQAQVVRAAAEGAS